MGSTIFINVEKHNACKNNEYAIEVKNNAHRYNAHTHTHTHIIISYFTMSVCMHEYVKNPYMYAHLTNECRQTGIVR